MILVDMGGIIFSQVTTVRDLNKDLLRHLILNELLSINKKFRHEYGNMVLACEGGSWRKDVFPYYKASRTTAREKQAEVAPEEADRWKDIWKWVGELIEEWKEHIPWQVIRVWKAEADDIIGALAISFNDNREFGVDEKTLIVSRDKDFFQLHTKEIHQWDPVMKKFLKCPDPGATLTEHIIRGDAGDGIPNALSDDDAFFSPDKRQVTMTKKRYEEILMNSPVPPGYARNERLIDLRFIPDEIVSSIKDQYQQQKEKKATGLMNYLVSNRCNNLLTRLDQF